MKAMTVFPGKLGNPAAHTAAWGSATFRSLPLCFSTEEPVSRDPLLSEVGGQEIGSIGANFQVAAGWIFRPASSGHPIAGPAYGVKGWKCSLHLELEARGWGRSGCRAPLRNVRALCVWARVCPCFYRTVTSCRPPICPSQSPTESLRIFRLWLLDWVAGWGSSATL